MDKEEIIRRLKALEEDLPEGLKATANATDVIEDLNSYVLEYNLKFNEEKEKENIYQVGLDSRLSRPKLGPGALNLIRRIRDEAHRFAVVYHRLLRKKALFSR